MEPVTREIEMSAAWPNPMRNRREEILRDKSYIGDVLAHGAKRANEIADQVMQRVRGAVGLR